MNTAFFLSLIDFYTASAYTDHYIFGFSYKGNIYMAFAGDSDLPAIMKLEAASRGQGYSLRFKPNAAIKVALLPSAKVLCSTKFFEDMVNSSKYNRGEIFEKLVTEYFGQSWVKDHIPYTEAGDIEVNGVSYQIKYEKATFINEKTMANMRRG